MESESCWVFSSQHQICDNLFFMSLVRQRPRLQILSHGPKQRNVEQSYKDISGSGGCLTPDLQPNPPVFPTKPEEQCKIYKIGKYLLEHVEAETYKACDCQTREEKICKV